MNPTFNSEKQSFIWIKYFEDGRALSFSLLFLDAPFFSTFRHEFIRCLYDTSHEDLLTNLKRDEQEYFLNAYEDDLQMIDASDDDDESEEDYHDDEKKIVRGIQDSNNEGAKNSQLAVGFKNDQSFVVKGSKIDVFNTDWDNSYALRFSTAINNVQCMEGKLFSPQKIMLHNQDQDLLMMKHKDDHNIYKMDLEYGKVVEQWHVDDYITIENVVPEKKYSQLTSTQTLIGFNEKSLFRIDPRVSGNKR